MNLQTADCLAQSHIPPYQGKLILGAFSLLQLKEPFLTFDLCSQFFLAWQIQLIFAGKKLLIAVQHGISGDIFIRFGTENDPERGIVTLASFQFIIHPNIHIHLPDILMRDLIRLKVDQNKTFKDIIVKDKVDLVIIQFCVDMLLARHKGIPLSHFH